MMLQTFLTRWHYFKTRAGFEKAIKRLKKSGNKFSSQINRDFEKPYHILEWYPNPALKRRKNPKTRREYLKSRETIMLPNALALVDKLASKPGTFFHLPNKPDFNHLARDLRYEGYFVKKSDMPGCLYAVRSSAR